jgi:hypothetical protein
MEDLNFGEAPINISPRSNKKFPSRFFILVIIVIVLALIIFGVSKIFFNKQSTVKKEVLITPTVALAPTKNPEATKAAEITPTKSAGKTPTPTPKSKPAAGELDKTKVSIEVQNGSGEAGVASKMATFLKDLGYTVSSTGNADNYEYTGVTIQTKLEFKDYIATLKTDLTPDYIVSSSTSDLAETSTADILVIVGK